jgi:hypothetical protein
LISPGRRADLLLLRLDSHCFTPLNDPLRQLVLSSPRSALAATIVGGRVVMRDGLVAGVNERDIFAEAREIATSLVRRGAEARSVADALLESVRAGWLDALSGEVGIARTVPFAGAPRAI